MAGRARSERTAAGRKHTAERTLLTPVVELVGAGRVPVAAAAVVAGLPAAAPGPRLVWPETPAAVTDVGAGAQVLRWPERRKNSGQGRFMWFVAGWAGTLVLLGALALVRF